MVPAMVERLYKSFALAPQEVLLLFAQYSMVIYGVGTGTSITGLFMADLGILIGLALIALCYIYCKKRLAGRMKFYNERKTSSCCVGGTDPLIIMVVSMVVYLHLQKLHDCSSIRLCGYFYIKS